MENSFRNFMAVLITLLLAAAWVFPAAVIVPFNEDDRWGILYVPIVILTGAWGNTIYNTYFKN